MILSMKWCDRRMFLNTLIPAVAMSMACVAQAGGEKEACAELEKGLLEQLQVLRGITDKAQAQARISALDRVLKKLQALNAKTNGAELWRYIDNTPGVKQPLITILEDTMVQLQRIERAKFFGNHELRRRLEPMVKSTPTPRV